MALFLQIIQSKKQYFNVKKNALKCLTVVFRDLINFSKDSINMILKPAWKLLNSHLPVFTEVVAYNNPIPTPDELDSD
jgi:NADPH-dependent 7-cyano-7-deazaguanine reductase QueF